MINHRQLEAFTALVAMGSTVKAAELLGTSQPAVSRLVKQLEIESKLKLFDRDGGRMRPTREGLAFHREVDLAFMSLRKLELVAHEIRTNDRGQLRMGALPALGFAFVPDVLAEFASLQPGTLVKVETVSSATIRDVVASGQFDLGFVADEVDIAGILAERFASPPVVCIMPPGHPLAAKSVITPQDLADQPFISLSSVDRTRRRIDTLFEKVEINRKIVVEAHFALSVCQLVARGLGLGLINPYSLGSILPDSLVVRAFSPKLHFNTLMIYPADRPISDTVMAFRKIAHERAAPALEALLQKHGVLRDEASRQVIGAISPPGPWIRNPLVRDSR